MSKKFVIADALQLLAPGAEWTLVDEDYENINWINIYTNPPTLEEINLEIERLQYEYDILEYQRLRKEEYPPFADYLDGIVKNDQAQIQAYIDACQAVKNKYPKPELPS